MNETQKHPLADAKIYLCKYKVNSLVFMLNETSIFMDHSNILSIEYCCDYEFNIRAILKISLRLDVRQKIWLLRNKRDIVAKFEFSKYGIDGDSEEANTTVEHVWNQEFKIYFNDTEESTDANSMEQRIDMNEGGAFATTQIENESYFESQNVLDIFLFDQELLNASNNIFNEIFTANTLQTCIGRLLTVTKHNKVLMSPFENDEIYKELLVPAYPSWKSLVYLDQYYGFYKTGAIIFYDIDKLYILNSNGRVTAKEPDEWVETMIYVTSIDMATPGNGMFRMMDQPIFYISLNEMDVNPNNFSESKNEELGSEAKIVVSDDITVNIASADQSVMDQRNERIVYTKKDDNKFLPIIMSSRMEENNHPMYVSGQNLDINAFKPNKTYTFAFDDPGKSNRYAVDKFYRLSYAYHVFKPDSDEYMTSTHRVVLRQRVSDDTLNMELNNNTQ